MYSPCPDASANAFPKKRPTDNDPIAGQSLILIHGHGGGSGQATAEVTVVERHESWLVVSIILIAASSLVAPVSAVSAN